VIKHFLLDSVQQRARLIPARAIGHLVPLSFSWHDRPMPDRDPKLTPADASDIAESVAFALLFSGKKRVHDSDQMMASIVAQRIVRHLENCGYAIFKQQPLTGSAPLNPPASYPQRSPRT
jgi:hypothetical protein